MLKRRLFVYRMPLKHVENDLFGASSVHYTDRLSVVRMNLNRPHSWTGTGMICDPNHPGRVSLNVTLNQEVVSLVSLTGSWG